MPTATTSLNPAQDPAVRRTGIGGSDAPAILGLSKWKSPLDVYLEKRGLVEPEEAGEAADWGQILEPVIISEFSQRQDVAVVARSRWGIVTVFWPDGSTDPLMAMELENWEQLMGLMNTLRHPDADFMMCHLDGVVVIATGEGPLREADRLEPVGLLEAKTSSAFRNREWGEEEDEIPEEYVIQCTHNAEIVRAHLGYFLPVFMPVLIGGQKWKVFRPVSEHNSAFIEDLMALEADFWMDVVQGNAPAAEPDDRGKKALNRLYPEDEGEERIVEPHEELHELAVQLAQARVTAKEATDHQTGAENKIKERMGTASKLLGTGWTISWKKTKDREKTDWEAVANALREHVPADAFQETVKAHTEIKEGYRMFRPNFKGLEEK